MLILLLSCIYTSQLTGLEFVVFGPRNPKPAEEGLQGSREFRASGLRFRAFRAFRVFRAFSAFTVFRAVRVFRAWGGVRA